MERLAGNHAALSHDFGWSTHSYHLSAIYVSGGESVTPSTVIGAIGQTGLVTGPHLHFEMHTPEGRPIDPPAVPGERAMRHTLLVASLAVSFALSACRPSQSESMAGTAASRAAASRPAALLPAAADTAGLRAALSTRGLSFEATLAARDSFRAVLAGKTGGDLRYLVALRGSAGSWRLLGEPEELMAGFRPDRVAWLTLGSDQVRALFYAHEQPVEGVVGTVVRNVDGTRLPLSYADSGSVCTASRLRDLDGDGVQELLAYAEDAAGGSCSSPCYLGLLDRFGTPSAWVRALRWNGSAWEPAEERFPELYRELGRVYREVAAWLSAADAGTAADTSYTRTVCRARTPWLAKDPELFVRWAERADRVARSGAEGPPHTRRN